MPTERSIVLFQKKGNWLTVQSSRLFGSDLSTALSHYGSSDPHGLPADRYLRGISLPMMTFSFRPASGSTFALDGSFGQHAGGLLEGCSGQEGVVCQSSLGDAQQHPLVLNQLQALFTRRRCAAADRR